MKLTVPANYDPTILAQLKNYGTFEIYGKLPSDVVGGGRPSYMAAPLSRKRLETYITQVHNAGMEFNYLLNSACLGNQEWSKSFHKKFNSLLEWLTKQNVETLTISIPYLVQVVKQRFPHFKIKVGIYAQIDTVKRAKYWEDLGVDTINLESFSINRDFETLAQIRQAVACDLVLIANHFCQPNCPYQIQHQNGHAHASSDKRTFLVDYPLIQCQKNRLTHKELFISALWIRPEDLGHYENIGYTTFKLLERNIPSENLLQRAKAYHERRFDGNLADLILSWGFKKPAHRFSWPYLFKYFQPWKLPIKAAAQSFAFLKDQGMMIPQEQNPIFIDTAAIPKDFLKPFLTGSCGQRDCQACGYCQGIAEKAVTIDPSFLAKILPQYENLEGQLVSGQLWGLKS